jgi:tryptophan synthase alpha chain
MSRLNELFNTKNSKVLNVYCTAGYPELESTLPVMKSLEANGADIIELGMPYSDPLADGEVIQASSARALKNGMTITMLFRQLKEMRKQVSIPVILMGYMNPVMQYGFERFCKDAKEAGVDGLILPDLPEYEFENEYGAIIQKFGLDFIFLVTPETSPERIMTLDQLSTGFLYAVSSSSTTGAAKDMGNVSDFLQRLSTYKLKNPVLVGFGIKDKESFERASNYANGAIIGTAYIKAIGDAPDVNRATSDFLSSILQ